MSSQQLWLPEPDGPSSRLKCELDLERFCITLLKPKVNDKQYYQPTNCPQAAAVVTSTALHKYDAWLPDYRHEFIVVHFECPPNNRPPDDPPRQYVLHVNRSWDSNTGGWRDWVPIPTWEGVKAAYDEVSIYLAGGGEEEEARAGTHIVAKVSFEPQSVYLVDFAWYLQDRSRSASDYSFVGVNCWSWSRILIGGMVAQKSDIVVQADIADSKGVLKVVSTEELSRFLLENVWAMLGSLRQGQSFLSYFQDPGENNDGASLWGAHLLVFLFQVVLLLGSFNYPHMWFRRGYVHVTKENAIWFSSRQDVTHTGKPHVFINPFRTLASLSMNTAISPYSNSLCSPGCFLFSLTPPLPSTTYKFRWLEVAIESREMRKSDVLREMQQPDVVQVHPPKGPRTRFAWGIVRVQEENGTRTLVQPTPLVYHVGWNAAWNDTSIPMSEHSMTYHIGADHPLLQALRPGDMVGLWAISDHEGIVNVVGKARLSAVAARYWWSTQSLFSSRHATFLHPETSTHSTPAYGESWEIQRFNRSIDPISAA